jgi:hypothetical protein
MYGGFPKRTFEQDRSPKLAKSGLGQAEHSPTRKIRHKKKKNPPGKKTGGRWRQG